MNAVNLNEPYQSKSRPARFGWLSQAGNLLPEQNVNNYLRKHSVLYLFLRVIIYLYSRSIINA